ncbi:MAG: TspO/MBR family protein [Halobacteriales archaeon]|nr:TspO/MBR family protein [Halobacteriales archaeon]
MQQQTDSGGLSVPDSRTLLTALGFVVGVNAVGALPAAFVGADTSWIDKPAFFPPELAFPVIWTLLFTLLGVALYRVWAAPASRDRSRALTLFAGQFALNVVWTPVFFGLRAPTAALAIILALWVAILATVVAFDRVDRPAAALFIPYFAWVSFAAVLNAAIAF